jgi:dihydrofolate reductase
MLSRKLILYIATSIDGYIANPDGDTSWLHAPEYTMENEDFGYNKFVNEIDTTLMGHNTYKVVTGFDLPFPYADKTNYVFSKTNTGKDQNAEFINDSIPEFITSLKQKEGNNIWLIGGGQINTLLLENHLIDEMIITQVPIVLGSGLPLFTKAKHSYPFFLNDSKSFKNGFVQLHYYGTYNEG